MKKIRKRSSYHNLVAYDTTYELILELLAHAEELEEEVLEDLVWCIEAICKVYQETLPFYNLDGVVNEIELQKLLLSLTKGNGSIETKMGEVLDYINEKIIESQTQQVITWLIMDYEWTAQQTAQSIGPKAVNILATMTPADKKYAVQSPWCKDNKTFEDRIRTAAQSLDANLKTIIVQGYRRGWSVEKMSKMLAEAFGIEARKAQRIIRTETLAVWSKATKEEYLANNIGYVEIIGDAACGGICTEYVDEVIPLRDAGIGTDLPPYHPNCACSFCSYEEYTEGQD